MNKDKTLTPPEVVQALLDGKTVRRNVGWNYRLAGQLYVDTNDCRGWRRCDLSVDEMLLAEWSIVPEYYDFQEAVRRMKDGGKVRRDAWPLAMSVMLLPGDHSPGLIIIIGTINHNKYYLAAIEDIEATDWEDA